MAKEPFSKKYSIHDQAFNTLITFIRTSPLTTTCFMKNFQQKSLDGFTVDRSVKAPPVTDYMVKKLITFSPDTPISEVIESLLSNRITGAPVLNDKKQVVSLIDDKDCLNVLFGGVYHNRPVGDDTVASYMSNVMKTISIHADILEVANTFLTTPYKRLLVMDDNGKLAGQISRRDVLRAIKDMKFV
jgi:predicted transcriptional regulator